MTEPTPMTLDSMLAAVQAEFAHANKWQWVAGVASIRSYAAADVTEIDRLIAELAAKEAECERLRAAVVLAKRWYEGYGYRSELEAAFAAALNPEAAE